MSKVIEPTTDTLGRDLAWLELSPEERERIRYEVEIEMTPGSVWLERQMAGDGMTKERDGCTYCPGCVLCTP